MTQTSTTQVYAASVMVPVDDLHPNSYNPNVVPDMIFEEILKDIRKNGFIGAIVVRTRPEGGYEIVDGEHRYKAAKQLGFKEIPVIVREYDDDTARINTFRWNHERGFFDAIKTADLIRDLNKRHSLDERPSCR